MRIIKQPIINVLNDHLIRYPTPASLTYFWNFGSLAGVCLGIQLLTGIFLAMHYTPHIDYAFLSVEHIMRDVNYGWLLRYMHANGASMFLLVLYIHMFRGLYYGSYKAPRTFVWLSGVIIFLLTMGTAFIGYVLPWGQMSLWGATVITNLLSAVPKIGVHLVEWVWGGFSVDNATLNRFFSLHYLLPFIIAALVMIHLAALHLHGSSTPVGITSQRDKIGFYPYFYVKDLFGTIGFFVFFSFFIFFAPNVLGHPDNYIEANPMVTPTHIVPEWYFLPFYAILRSIPNKLLGVIAMLAAILILAVLPILNYSKVQSSQFQLIGKKTFWFFLIICLFLGWIGGLPVKDPYVTLGQIATGLYFSYFLFLTPIISIIENLFIKYKLAIRSS